MRFPPGGLAAAPSTCDPPVAPPTSGRRRRPEPRARPTGTHAARVDLYDSIRRRRVREAVRRALVAPAPGVVAGRRISGAARRRVRRTRGRSRLRARLPRPAAPGRRPAAIPDRRDRTRGGDAGARPDRLARRPDPDRLPPRGPRTQLPGGVGGRARSPTRRHRDRRQAAACAAADLSQGLERRLPVPRDGRCANRLPGRHPLL